MKPEKETPDSFDWHSDSISNETQITGSYRTTQNVRRFFRNACGPEFKMDRSFMQWMKDGSVKTMGEAAREWLRRAAEPRSRK